MENVKDEFELGEEVIVEIGSRKVKAIYECQMTFSSDPDRDRFRVKVEGNYVYVSRLQIHKNIQQQMKF